MEIIERDYALGLITNPKDRMLLQRKDLEHIWWPGYWLTFGGGIKTNEDPKEAFLREINEETELELFNVNLFHKLNFENYSKTGPKKIVKGDKYYFAAKFDGDLGKIRLREGAGFSVFEDKELTKLNDLELIVPDNYFIVDLFYKILKFS